MLCTLSEIISEINVFIHVVDFMLLLFSCFFATCWHFEIGVLHFEKGILHTSLQGDNG